MISVIITTFNRRHIVNYALESALAFLRDAQYAEIILVDDCSSDGTVDSIKDQYQQCIEAGVIKIIELEQNIGVTGAKNAGATIASNQWITFLDSDDQLIPNTYGKVVAALNQFSNDELIVFFRCISTSGMQIGEYLDRTIELSVDYYILNGTFGESIPFIKRNLFLNYKYPSQLRGFEGLSYFEILLDGYKAIILPIFVRYYSDDTPDSLSNLLKSGNRSRTISIGYFRMLKRGFMKLNIVSHGILFSKFIFHFFIFLINYANRFFKL